MRRGDIYVVDLEPVLGTEANKTRPAVIVSGDGANKRAARNGRGVLTVVPVTSSTARVFPFQTLIAADRNSGLSVLSKAQAEQVRSLDIARFGRRLGQLDDETLSRLDDALRLHLAL